MRRVVVTGLGLVTPIGVGGKEVYDRLCNGVSGVGPITRFDASNLETKIAAEVKDFNPENYIPKKEIKRMDIFIQYALAAAHIAMQDAGLDITDEVADRVGTYIGTGLGGLPSLEYYHRVLLEKGPKKISPFFIPMLIGNMASGYVSMKYKAKGPCICVVSACASGNHSIGEAFKSVQRGDCDVAICGGTEANLTPLTVAGFNAMKALSTRNDEPEKASRPFDKNRDGFVVGEGAGVMILEELEFAKKRGAEIYAEIVGYGATSDAYHITAPDPEGDGARRAMEMALRDARVNPEEVDYINAHGTSTKLNDYIETLAIKKVFGEKAYSIPISSNKSMIGHLLGAAGAVESIFTVYTIKYGIIPPTINLEERDPDCDLDYVPNTAREADVKVAMNNSFGFGGTNAVLVFRRFED